MSGITVTKKIDLSGLPCPMPVVKISKEIKTVEVGEIIEARTTDPGALSDFPAWAQSSGNEIVKIEESGDGATFFVKRTA
jgi:TusA-related sulfurtransferase